MTAPAGADLAASGAALLGGRLRAAVPLPGGDLSQLQRITLADGRQAVVKSGPAPRIEAAMLRAVAASGAPAPAVLAVSDRVLAIALLPSDGRLSAAWGALGIALATLHAHRGAGYGWPADYAFGPVAIANTPSPDWPDFWATRRLAPCLPDLPPDLAHRVAVLAGGLPQRLPARPPPALLHGDLWGGNVVVAAGRVSGLIDPACYHGDGEVDIAMLTLFDRPGPAFHRSYGSLAPGHRERLPIYRLWPALVHLRLFGDGYRALVERQLAACGV